MTVTDLSENSVAEQVKQLPARPGVYLMKDAKGEILYVGKAASLHHRVRSYFGAGEKLSEKIQRMTTRVKNIDFFITGSEQEALILELNLIKRYRPPFNVRLKDDKTFPYLKIDVTADWPSVQITRRLQKDGARYFGPFASAKSVRQTLKVIRKIFPIRSCSKPIDGKDARPCLDYNIYHCLGPCVDAISKEEYHGMIKQVIMFLEGRQEHVVQELEDKMKQAAGALNFEKAALLRDQIEAVKSVVEGQRIAATVSGEQDVIAFASDKDQTYVQVFFIRGGKLIGRESFTLQGTEYEEPQQIMTNFVKQFYNSSAYIPPVILLQYPVDDKEVIGDWLESKREGKVQILVPRRGSKKELVDTVAENARQGLELAKASLATSGALSQAIDEVRTDLHLPQPLARIEGYDISNIQGMAAVGSMVVFENGKLNRAHYRHFRIKTVSGADDYAMLQEVLRRRFKRTNDASDTWAILPDLILIDGGKGQLNAALSVVKEMKIDSVSVASLAKENEEIFVPHRQEPIVLPRQSPGLQLLQRVRDESHRFALGYYQKVHKRESFESLLDSVPGIGTKRKRALLRKFGSVQAIREASLEELATVKGMTKASAAKIKEYL